MMNKLQLSVSYALSQTDGCLSDNNSFNKSTGPYSKTEVMFSLGARSCGFSLRCSQ